MSGDERLFGFDDDEHLESDLAAVVDRWADNHLGDPDDEFDADAPTEILEWSVQSTIGIITPAYTIIEHITEWSCDGIALEDDPFESAYSDLKVVAAAEALRQAIAATCSWTWADQIVARHQITVVDGELHVDGEQFYKPKESS